MSQPPPSGASASAWPLAASSGSTPLSGRSGRQRRLSAVAAMQALESMKGEREVDLSSQSSSPVSESGDSYACSGEDSDDDEESDGVQVADHGSDVDHDGDVTYSDNLSSDEEADILSDEEADFCEVALGSTDSVKFEHAMECYIRGVFKEAVSWRRVCNLVFEYFIETSYPVCDDADPSVAFAKRVIEIHEQELAAVVQHTPLDVLTAPTCVSRLLHPDEFVVFLQWALMKKRARIVKALRCHRMSTLTDRRDALLKEDVENSVASAILGIPSHITTDDVEKMEYRPDEPMGHANSFIQQSVKEVLGSTGRWGILAFVMTELVVFYFANVGDAFSKVAHPHRKDATRCFLKFCETKPHRKCRRVPRENILLAVQVTSGPDIPKALLLADAQRYRLFKEHLAYHEVLLDTNGEYEIDLEDELIKELNRPLLMEVLQRCGVQMSERDGLSIPLNCPVVRDCTYVFLSKKRWPTLGFFDFKRGQTCRFVVHIGPAASRARESYRWLYSLNMRMQLKTETGGYMIARTNKNVVVDTCRLTCSKCAFASNKSWSILLHMYCFHWSDALKKRIFGVRVKTPASLRLVINVAFQDDDADSRFVHTRSSILNDFFVYRKVDFESAAHFVVPFLPGKVNKNKKVMSVKDNELFVKEVLFYVDLKYNGATTLPCSKCQSFSCRNRRVPRCELLTEYKIDIESGSSKVIFKPMRNLSRLLNNEMATAREVVLSLCSDNLTSIRQHFNAPSVRSTCLIVHPPPEESPADVACL